MGDYADEQIERDNALFLREAVAAAKKKKREVSCPVCKRHVKEIGLANHMRDAHPCLRETTAFRPER